MKKYIKQMGAVASTVLFATVSVVSGAANIDTNELVVVALAESPVPDVPAQVVEDVPLGQSAEGDVSLLPEDVEIAGEEDDLFGLKGGYFHPYLTLTAEYTDNLFNLDEERTSNVLTVITPGIWFSIPRKKQIPVTVAPHNSSPGGVQLQLDDYAGEDKYQLYLLASLDYKMYSADSDLNDESYILEGMFRYNFSGGLSLQIVDRYTHTQDRFEVGFPDSRNTHIFDSNWLVGTADWRITEKLRVQADLSLFDLVYDEDVYDYLDREDLAFDLYGYFDYSLKTSFFLEYKHVNITYDVDSFKDSEQDNLLLGVKYDSTEKLAYLAKLGYQTKEYTSNTEGFSDYDGVTVELQALYKFSEKVKLTLDGYYRNEETDDEGASDKTVLGVAFGYDHEFSDRLSGRIRLRYENADYTEVTIAERDDDRIVFRPSLQYAFREWLMAEVGYEYDTRNSTNDVYDYYTNSFFIDVNLAL